MVCKFLLFYRYLLGISLSMSFLLTFMDSVVQKKLTHSIVYIQCCWLSTWQWIKCFVPGGSSPEEREWWGRDMLLLALQSSGMTPISIETTALTSTTSSCFSARYCIEILWLALLAGEKKKGGGSSQDI